MILEYNGNKENAIMENLEIKTNNKELNKIISNNKIQKTLLLCYFGNVETIIVENLL